MSRMSDVGIVSAVALFVVCAVGAPPARAACGAPFLITSIDGAQGLYSYVITPGTAGGTGLDGTTVTENLGGAFWALGLGNPASGVGADNGTFQAPAWLLLYPDYPALILTTWAASTDIDTCIDQQGALGERCQVTLFTDVNPQTGAGAFALVTTPDDPASGDFFLIPGGGADIELAPLPVVAVPDDPVRDGDRLTFSVGVPAFSAFSDGLYLNDTDGCARPVARAIGTAGLIDGARLRIAVVPGGTPVPAVNDIDAWAPADGDTVSPLGISATVVADCSGGDVYLAYTLLFDSGFESEVVSTVVGPFSCNDCGNGQIDDGETCDDGNTEPGDGCDAQCQIETCQDGDGDGFGSPGSSQCSGGDAKDCDDGDPLTFPGADETCDGLDNDCDGVTPADEDDRDGDGFRVCDGDCNDDDPTIFPGADEICDGLDNDCDGSVPDDERDGDQDGVSTCEGDCDDGDPSAFPGNDETLCDTVDNDCDPSTGDDVNADGDPVSFCEGDCADSDPAVYPGAPELCDRIDNDCDGVVPGDEIDDDGDGPAECEGDCDDGDAAVNPSATELLCDDIDNDCNAATEDDRNADGDPVSFCDDDCDDDDPTRYPGSDEICDGIDNDCDGVVPADELDDDGDGFSECAGDCDDADATRFPDAPEICDGLDNDCDGVVPGDEIDDDGDAMAECEGDCDDGNANAFPGNTEALCDAVDNDCDTATPDDVNADGDPISFCDADCDDNDPTTYPGAAETCDGLDNDCDGLVPDDEQDGDGDGFSECLGDCNDADAAVGPDAEEICGNDVDDDCDGDLDIDDDDCEPMLVVLDAFEAQVTRDGVQLRWTTATEIDNFGFRILRSRVGGPEKGREWVPVSPVIHAAGDALEGASYRFLDRDRQPHGTVLYYLEDIDRNGKRTVHGPVQVRLNGRRHVSRPAVK